MKISEITLNNGEDVPNVKCSFKNKKDVITLNVDVVISFAMFAFQIGIQFIISALKD